MVEPVHPFERGELDGFEGPPWSTSMDELCLVKAVDGLGERIVVAVADAADGWLYTPTLRKSGKSLANRA
jgi:hypothetical protein